MKKIVSFLLALVLTLSLTSTALAAVVSPKTDVAEVMAGEAVKLTVNASEEEPLTGIVCLNYRVYFDPALFELDAQASASGMDGVKLTALKTDEDGKSYYAVSLLDPTSEGLGVKGDLYSLVFKLKDDAAAGAEGTFTITKAHVYTIADGAMQTVENGAVENGTLTVKVAAQPVPEVVFGHSAASGKPMLTWDAVPGAESYNVYRAESEDGPYTRINSTTATSYVNTGAKEGVTYYYKVTAVSAGGESEFSNIVSGQAKAEPQKPAAPVVKIGSSASSGKPMLTWSAVTGAESYNVYRAESADGVYTKINTTTATSYVNTGAKEGVTYYYKVTAVNDIGESDASNVVSGQTKVTPQKPSAPVVRIGHSAASGKPMLKWNTVTGATSYNIYRAESAAGTYTRINTTTATSYTNTGAKEGVTYYYKVTAVNGVGESAYSNVVSGQVKSTGQTTVTTLTMGHSSTSGKPQLTWKAVSGAASYRVYRATTKNGAYTVINTTKALTYTNVGAALGTTYYYKVEALNAAGKSMGFSAVVEGKVAPVLAVGYSSVSGKPQLTWKAVPGATEYQVYRSTQQNSGYTKINTTTSTSYVNTGAKANTTYYYRIVAVKGTAASDFSNIVSARPSK